MAKVKLAENAGTAVAKLLHASDHTVLHHEPQIDIAEVFRTLMLLVSMV